MTLTVHLILNSRAVFIDFCKISALVGVKAEDWLKRQWF